MILHSALRWGRTRARLFAYGACAGIVTVWTLLRFFTQRTIFDLVGQQVVAGQWIHGYISGAGIGVTNYLLKIFTFYMPLSLLPGSPRAKLIILTILINILTIVCIGLIAEKILKIYKIPITSYFYYALVWLSCATGSVFWIQFANSRNIEVVGGFYITYLALRYTRTPKTKDLLVIWLLSTVLFFADSLQIYMTALPLMLYGGWTLRKQWQKGAALAVTFAASILAGALLLKAVFALTHTRLIAAADNQTLGLTTLARSGVDSITKLTHLYSGGIDAGRARQAVTIFTLLILTALAIYTFVRQRAIRPLAAYSILTLAVNIAVFAASGQAPGDGNERYLIMTAPVLLLALASARPPKTRPLNTMLGAALVGCLCMSTVLLAAKTIRTPHGFQQDKHLAHVVHFANTHPNIRIYSSMDTAIPVAYYYPHDAPVLPLACQNGQLYKNSTFYTKEAYNHHESTAPELSAIVLDDHNLISNTPFVCDLSTIQSQLGDPDEIINVQDNTYALIYHGKALSTLPFND